MNPLLWTICLPTHNPVITYTTLSSSYTTIVPPPRHLDPDPAHFWTTARPRSIPLTSLGKQWPVLSCTEKNVQHSDWHRQITRKCRYMYYVFTDWHTQITRKCTYYVYNQWLRGLWIRNKYTCTGIILTSVLQLSGTMSPGSLLAL